MQALLNASRDLLIPIGIAIFGAILVVVGLALALFMAFCLLVLLGCEIFDFAKSALIRLNQ